MRGTVTSPARSEQRRHAMRVKPAAPRSSANRYNRFVTCYGRIAVVLLSALQCWASPALAQNQRIGGFAQAFEAGADGGDASPRYRVEVLAFAYNGFDPNEEIFPDEPFEILLDTRPPKHLIAPAPRDSGLLAALHFELPAPRGLAEPGQVAVPEADESGGSVSVVATPGSPGGPAPPSAVAPDETGPTAEEVSGSQDSIRGNGEIEPSDQQDADMYSNLEGVAGPQPVPSNEPMGPADDGTLFTLLYESMTAGEEVLPGHEQYPIRTAYIQRLIASLQSLEDQSRVPLVFDPVPAGPLPPGAGASDPDPRAGDVIDPGASTADANDPGGSAAGATAPGANGAGEPDPAISTPRPAFRVLRSDELELRGALLRLQRDADYTPLAHGGWVQPTYPPEQAIPVDISLLGTVNPVGTVQLHLSRFLHVTVDLVYRAPPVPPPLQTAPAADGVLSELELPLRYALRTQRPVRSGEVNYLDHPAIGLLVIVRPQRAEPEDTGDSLIPPRGPAA